MKKNIGFITLDSSLVQWLRETLRTSAPQNLSAQELLEGFRDLLDGTAGSLMLELGEGSSPAAGSDIIRCGALSIDPRLRRVSRDGTEIPLTPKEFDILCFLARNRGEVLQRSRYTRLYGKVIICWTTAISWRLSGSCARKLSPIRTLRNIS